MRNIKAFGLVEILVGLAIFSTAIIATVTIAVNSYKAVKNNELADLANSVMIRSVEYFKSPSSIGSLTPAGSATSTAPVYYKLNVTISPETTGTDSLSFVRVTTNVQPLTECTESSEYRVNFSSTQNLESSTFLLCNQIIVEPLTEGGYIIKSRIVYQTSKGTETAEILGYRQPSSAQTPTPTPLTGLPINPILDPTFPVNPTAPLL